MKPIALAGDEGGFVAASEGTLLNRTSPLTRTITVFLNRPPGAPVDQKLAEFLRYVLSREGQAVVAEHGGGYLPILAPFAVRELRKLD